VRVVGRLVVVVVVVVVVSVVAGLRVVVVVISHLYLRHFLVKSGFVL
jgi:hypothetical protein